MIENKLVFLYIVWQMKKRENKIFIQLLFNLYTNIISLQKQQYKINIIYDKGNFDVPLIFGMIKISEFHCNFCSPNFLFLPLFLLTKHPTPPISIQFFIFLLPSSLVSIQPNPTYIATGKMQVRPVRIFYIKK